MDRNLAKSMPYDLYRSGTAGHTLNSGGTPKVTTAKSSTIGKAAEALDCGPTTGYVQVSKDDANPVVVRVLTSCEGTVFHEIKSYTITESTLMIFPLGGVDCYFEIENLNAVDAKVWIHAKVFYELGA